MAMHIVHPNLIDMIGEETSSSDESDEEWNAKWLVRPAELQSHVSRILDAIPTRKFLPETFMATARYNLQTTEHPHCNLSTARAFNRSIIRRNRKL
jgi:hypothetical protein